MNSLEELDSVDLISLTINMSVCQRARCQFVVTYVLRRHM